MHLRTLLSSLLVLFIFSACGYKPSAQFSRDVIGERVSTNVLISGQDPENTVLIKDAVNEALVKIFHSSLVSRSDSQTHLDISITEPSYTPLQYDKDGYVTGYRTHLTLNISRYHNGLSKKYTSGGTYDFSIAANAVITDQEQFDAIKYSAKKAIKSFIAQVAAEGARAKE